MTEPEKGLTGTEARLGTRDTRLVWAAAIIVAAIGAWLMFDAHPGINWGIWTACASIGLVMLMRARDTLNSSAGFMLAIATILAAGASINAESPIVALSCLGVMLFLALAMLFTIDPGLHRLTAGFVVAAPFIAAGNARDQRSLRFTCFLGDDADHAVDRVGSPQGSARTPNHLDTIDILQNVILHVPKNA